MKRILALGVIALVMTLGGANRASAQSPRALPCAEYGCKGVCFKFLGGIVMHGPLYNYGPYSGYYPFEPYGPWNAQLQYTGPYPNQGNCGWNHHAWFHRNHCGSGWGHYARSTWHNVHLRLRLPFHHASCGQSSCGQVSGGCSTCGTYQPRHER